jgi:hypothetical protein
MARLTPYKVLLLCHNSLRRNRQRFFGFLFFITYISNVKGYASRFGRRIEVNIHLTGDEWAGFMPKATFLKKDTHVKDWNILACGE